MAGNDFTAKLQPAHPTGSSTLAQERAGSNIDIAGLSVFLLGTEYLQHVSTLTRLLESEKLFSKSNQANLSRPERYMIGLARAKCLRRLADQHKWADETYEIAKYLVDDVSPYTLHTTMFRQTLREQASDEQQAYWLTRHAKWEIIGAYAQTEMGHGSNVRGIETEARWDPTTEEFVLHSPYLTSSKWWNGSLGRTANHAIVVAQLLIPVQTSGKQESPQFKKMGVQPFIVQVRDMHTHQPLSGIVIGDIGPKYGYAPMDNAYMLFNNFRIPHSAMLSRYAKLDPKTSEFTKPQNPNVVYGSLTEARSRIVLHARLVLARAVTIAVRYLCVRRQFHIEDHPDQSPTSSHETSVLDYTTVQIRVLPLLSATFALHFAGQEMKRTFDLSKAPVAKGDFSRLGELHNLSSGLKSYCTDLAANGIETCRRALGGHGYGGYSGLKQLNDDYLSKPTVEGDNWMITQQVAKYLIKIVGKVLQQSPEPATDEVNGVEAAIARFARGDRKPPSIKFDGSEEGDVSLVRAFEFNMAYQAFEIHQDKEVMGIPWNALLLKAHRLSQAQSVWILVRSFHQGLQDIISKHVLDQQSIPVLKQLFTLFALSSLSEQGLDLVASGVVSAEQMSRIVPNQIMAGMRAIRPHAVALVDAWALPDYLLDSSLGRYDGRVYEDMFNRAHRLNPLNRLTFNPDYKTDEIVLGADDGQAVLAKL